MKTLIQLRNEDFVRCCIDIFRNDCAMGAIRPLDTVIERALACQPLCHYLDYDSVSAKLHRIGRRGLEAEVSSPLFRAMWQELAEQVAETRQRRGRLNHAQALTFVLTFKRPSRFYISPDTAKRLLRPHITYSLTNKLSAIQ